MGIRINQLPSASTIDAGGDYFAVTQNGETKKINIETMTQNLLVAKKEYEKEVEKLKQLQDEMINARKHYNNLSERITKENEKVYETINYNDFKNYRGQDIKINKSKIGFTKDMQVEGMTYQNLIVSGNRKENILAGWQTQAKYGFITNELKKNSIYTLFFKIENKANSNIVVSINSGDNGIYEIDKNGTHTIKIDTTGTEGTLNGLWFYYLGSETNPSGTVANVMILEGDYTQPNSYIPSYFEGIKSVGEKENKISILSNGKNLFNAKKLQGYGENFTLIDETTNTFTISNHKNDINLISFMNMKLKGVTNVKVSGFTEKLSGTGIGLIMAYFDDGTFAYAGSSAGGEFETTFLKPIDKIVFSFTNGGITKFSNIMISEREITEFEPYKEDKKEILLPFTEGLKGLPNEINDQIVGDKVIQKVGSLVLNGSEDWGMPAVFGNTIRFQIYFENISGLVAISDKFMCKNDDSGIEHFKIGGYNGKYIFIYIEKTKLETQDVEGFKKWLQANPITVYYELAEPIEYKIENLDSINLKTYNEVTYINSENEIKPNIACKAPSLDEIRKGDN